MTAVPKNVVLYPQIVNDDHGGCHPNVKRLDTNAAMTAIFATIDGPASMLIQDQGLPSTTALCSACPL